jgi:hypothetical protein
MPRRVGLNIERAVKRQAPGHLHMLALSLKSRASHVPSTTLNAPTTNTLQHSSFHIAHTTLFASQLYRAPSLTFTHQTSNQTKTMANPPKIPISSASTTSTNPQVARELQDQITLALLANGGIARIQTSLRQRLDEAGWSENLREYVLQLFRSGECTSYFEAMEKVKARVRLEGRDEENGHANGRDAGLVVPVAAADGGVEAVRKELEGVCEMRKKEAA